MRRLHHGREVLWRRIVYLADSRRTDRVLKRSKVHTLYRRLKLRDRLHVINVLRLPHLGHTHRGLRQLGLERHNVFCVLRRLLRSASCQLQHLRHVRDILLPQLRVLGTCAQVVVLLRHSQPALDRNRNLLGRVLEVLLLSISKEHIHANPLQLADQVPATGFGSSPRRSPSATARPAPAPLHRWRPYPCTPCSSPRSSAHRATAPPRPPPPRSGSCSVTGYLRCTERKTGPSRAGRPESDGSPRTFRRQTCKSHCRGPPTYRSTSCRTPELAHRPRAAFRRRPGPSPAAQPLSSTSPPQPERPLQPIPSGVQSCLTSLTCIHSTLRLPLRKSKLSSLCITAPVRTATAPVTICTRCRGSCVCETLPLRATDCV